MLAAAFIKSQEGDYERLERGMNVNTAPGKEIDISEDGEYYIVGNKDYDDGSTTNLGRIQVYKSVPGDRDWDDGYTLLYFPTPSVGLNFGNKVAVSAAGDYIAGMTAPASGSRYCAIFNRVGGVWSHQQTVSADSGSGSVCFNTDATYMFTAGKVYTRSGSTWTLQAQLTLPTKPPENVTGYDALGYNDCDSTAVWYAVCSQGSVNYGTAGLLVYKREGTNWTAHTVVPLPRGSVSGSVAINSTGDEIVWVYSTSTTYGHPVEGTFLRYYTRTGDVWNMTQEIAIMPAYYSGGFCHVSMDKTSKYVVVNAVTQSNSSAFIYYRKSGGIWVETTRSSSSFANYGAISCMSNDGVDLIRCGRITSPDDGGTFSNKTGIVRVRI